jgi:hypothetical protein
MSEEVRAEDAGTKRRGIGPDDGPTNDLRRLVLRRGLERRLFGQNPGQLKASSNEVWTVPVGVAVGR